MLQVNGAQSGSQARLHSLQSAHTVLRQLHGHSSRKQQKNGSLCRSLLSYVRKIDFGAGQKWLTLNCGCTLAAYVGEEGGGGVKVNEGETEAEKKNEKEVQKKKKEKH